MFTKTGNRVGDRKYNALQEGEEGRYLAMIFRSDQLSHLSVCSPRLTAALLWEQEMFLEQLLWRQRLGTAGKEPSAWQKSLTLLLIPPSEGIPAC